MDANIPNGSPAPGRSELADLHAQMLRSGQRVNEDGSFDLGWGTFLLCMCMVPYLNALLPKTLWGSRLGYLPLLCGALAPYAIGKLIKRYLTWPRTGYVRNFNELTLRQLILIMVFGCCLGNCIGGLSVLCVNWLENSNHMGGHRYLHDNIFSIVQVLVCGFLTLYLWKKVIRKRTPSPLAHDSEVFTEQLSQTAIGRTQLRVVKWTLFSLFVGIPLFAFSVIIALSCLYKSFVQAQFHWSESLMLIFMVGCNAVLYLMGNAALIRKQKWKWSVLVFLVIGPIFAVPLVPCPAGQPEMLHGITGVMLTLGVGWFLSGVISLFLFLWRNPVAAGESL